MTGDTPSTGRWRFRLHAFSACLLIVSLVVQGCAFSSSRPTPIPEFSPRNGRATSHPSIAGCYADSGEVFSADGQSLGTVSLSHLVFPDAPDSDSVEIVEDGAATIDFGFFREGSLAGSRRLSEYSWWKAWDWDAAKLGQPFYPVNGFVEIEGEFEHGGAAGVGMYAFGQSCLLRKGVDDSLIVRRTVNAVGVAVVVPLSAARTIWCRFPPLVDGCAAATRTRSVSPDTGFLPHPKGFPEGVRTIEGAN